MRLLDGLMNLVSGMGTARDKGGQAEYYQPTYDPLQLITAYRASSLIRRVVDMPAEDACREWREWQAEADQITVIEAEESRLGYQGKVLEARRQARLFGGSAILIGTGDADPMKPLRPEIIKQGGISYLTLLTFSDIIAGDIERDPTLPEFSKPQWWQLTTVTGGNVRIHPSRLVIMHGIPPMTGLGYESLSGWGDSVLPGMLDAVKRVDEVAGNILSLVYEAKIDVIKIPDLMMNLQQRGAAFEAEVIRRMTLAATGKGINGTLILDAAEEYEQKSASFGGLPDTMDRFMQLASAASGIPMTLLFGMSPGGLNSTGDGDTRGYYDRVKVQQSMQMQPAMAILDECLIRSALGDRPKTIHFTWRPLWQPTAKERAETGKTMADAMKVVWDTDTVPAEAIGSALVNGLTECGAFPGFEGYVAAWYAENPNGDDGFGVESVPPAEDIKVAAVIADAAPRTLYVRRDVTNRADIVAWAKGEGFMNIVPDLHVTIAYSKTPVDWFSVGQSWADKLEMPAGGPRQMERLGPTGEYIALLITANELVWRNREIRDAGASWSWPDYQPHISIQIGGDVDLSKVKPYQGKIILGPEIFEELREE